MCQPWPAFEIAQQRSPKCPYDKLVVDSVPPLVVAGADDAHTFQMHNVARETVPQGM